MTTVPVADTDPIKEPVTLAELDASVTGVETSNPSREYDNVATTGMIRRRTGLAAT